MSGSGKRRFGLRPRIDDPIRGEGLVLESVAGVNWGSGERVQVGSFGRWAEHVPLLVRLPDREPYEASPKLWMTRAKYPIAGTTLPVTVDPDDASVVRIEWDEVPEIDAWIADRHPVFTDPDTVQRELSEVVKALRKHVRQDAMRDAAWRGATAMGPDSGVDAGALGDLLLRMQGPVEEQAAAAYRREPPPDDRPTARILAATPTGSGSGIEDDGENLRDELLLSVLVPGAERYGVRWRGRIRRMKLMTQWSDIAVEVNPKHHDRVKIAWDEVADGLDVAADRLRASGDKLEARLAAGPQADLGMLLDALSDPGQRAVVAPQTGQAVAAPDPLDQLKRLAQLRDAGALTASEFEAQKARLLDQI
jgi:hypothetical protein